MSETIYTPCIVSVRDQITKLNDARSSIPPRPTSSKVSGRPPLARPVEPRVCHPEVDDDARSAATDKSAASAASNRSAASAASTSRARKGDVYTVVSDEQILKILTEIDANRFVSNTACAPWTRGHKHHPNAPDTFKVRRHLSSSGPQTREQIQQALSPMQPKLLRAILHELKEQGIVHVERST